MFFLIAMNILITNRVDCSEITELTEEQQNQTAELMKEILGNATEDIW